MSRRMSVSLKPVKLAWIMVNTFSSVLIHVHDSHTSRNQDSLFNHFVYLMLHLFVPVGMQYKSVIH